MTLMVCLVGVALVFVGYYCGGAGMEKRPKHITPIVRPIPPSPLLRAVLEKRRVLERMREDNLRGLTSLIELRRNLAITESSFDVQTRSGGNQIDQIDKQLLELADDEAVLTFAETPEADEFAKDVRAPRCADTSYEDPECPSHEKGTMR